MYPLIYILMQSVYSISKRKGRCADEVQYVRNFHIAKCGEYTCMYLHGSIKEIWGTEAGYRLEYILCER